MKPIISIIVPVYNAEKYIGKCIDSVIGQSYSKWELLLVDDGSTDSSSEICKKYLSDNRIHYLFQKNRGVSAARNLGLQNTSGDYCLFLDSDDFLASSCLERCVVELETNLLDTLQFGFDKVALDGTKLSHFGVDTDVYNGKEYGKKCNFLINVCGIITKKTIIEKNTIYFDEHIRLAEDQLYIMSILANSERVKQISDGLYNYVQIPTSSIHNMKAKDLRASIDSIIHFKYTSLFSEYIDILLIQFIIDYFRTPNAKIWDVYKMINNHIFQISKRYGSKYFYILLILYSNRKLALRLLKTYAKIKEYKYSVFGRKSIVSV